MIHVSASFCMRQLTSSSWLTRYDKLFFSHSTWIELAIFLLDKAYIHLLKMPNYTFMVIDHAQHNKETDVNQDWCDGVMVPSSSSQQVNGRHCFTLITCFLAQECILKTLSSTNYVSSYINYTHWAVFFCHMTYGALIAQYLTDYE